MCCLFTFQLLIGFELGAVVMWDLKTKLADVRFSCSEVRVASSDTIQYNTILLLCQSISMACRVTTASSNLLRLWAGREVK